MRYCTLADLQKAIPATTLIQLSNDTVGDFDGPPAVLNMEIIEEAVRQAEELVDVHLRGRYNLPLDPVPTLVKDQTVNLARHWLYARRPEGLELPDAVTRTYKDAMRLLEHVRDGKLTLGDQSGPATPEPGEVKVRAQRRHFDSNMLEKY